MKASELRELEIEELAQKGVPFIPLGRTTSRLPFEVADYIDFYSSLEHATNLALLDRLPVGSRRWLPAVNPAVLLAQANAI